MLRMPSPPTLQTSVGDVRCRPHRRPVNYFCGVVGALYPCERRQHFPPYLRAFPHCGAQSASLSIPPAARRIAERANALRNVCALPISPLPIRSRRWSRAHFNASPLRRSRSPRHASRRVWRFPSVGCRGWSRSNREGAAFGTCGVLRTYGVVRFAEKKRLVLRSIVPIRAKKFHVAQLRIACSSLYPPAARYRHRVHEQERASASYHTCDSLIFCTWSLFV